MNDKELIEQNRLEAEAWMVAADNANLVDDLANFRKGAIAAANLCHLNASRLEALVAERDEAHDFALTVENIMAQYTGEHISAADACRAIYEELHKLPAILGGGDE